jgi:hypothetical protein
MAVAAVLGTLTTLSFGAARAQVPASPARSVAAGVPSHPGVIPVLEYHLIGERESRWSRDWRQFARDLELLHSRGFRPITIRQLVRREIDVGPGLSPVVVTFDDASPGQFRFIEYGDSLRVDPTSAVGIWEAFAAIHPEWRGRAVFCVLPAADSGHAFFGDKGIQGQRSAWRLMKVRYLVEHGYEICNHTLWHANLSLMSDAEVQEQIARAQLAVDSAVPGYAPRTLALPLGLWPRNRALLLSGAWKDPKTGKVSRYSIDAVLMVSHGLSLTSLDSSFKPMRIPRVQVFGNELVRLLDRLDRERGFSVEAAGSLVGRRHE